jgi:hypothetical protein
MGLDVIACGLGVLGRFTQLQIHVLRVATTSEFETHGTDFVEEKFMRLSYEWGRRFTNESLVN